MKRFFLFFHVIYLGLVFDLVDGYHKSRTFLNVNSKSSSKSCLLSHEIHIVVGDAFQCISNVDFDIVRSAAAGSLAGGFRALSRGLTFPFDSMKTFEQAKVGSGQKKRTIGDFFRGVIPTVLTAVPANAIFFITYEYLLAITPCFNPHISAVELLEVRLILSAIATIPQNIIKIPAELIKQRAQVLSESNFSLIIEQITAVRGWRGLYLGSGAMLLREIPYNALQMSVYASLQEQSTVMNFPPQGTVSTPLLAAILGLFAAAIAALLTQPADVVKTRIMTDLEQEDENTLQLNKQQQKQQQQQQISIISVSNYTTHSDPGTAIKESLFSPPISTSKSTSSLSSGENSKSADQPLWARLSIVRHCVEIVQEEGVKGLFSGLVPRLLLVSVGGMVYFWAAAVSDAYFDSHV